MKKFLLIIFSITVLSAVILACTSTPKISNTEESFKASGLSVRTPASRNLESAEATARGQIIIYTSMYENVFPEIERAMERHFPALDVIFVYGGTVQIQSRIEAEIKTGKLGCDILMVADPSYAIDLKEKGVLHSFTSRERQNLAFNFDPEGYWYPVRVSNMVFAFNPEKINRDNVPQMFYEFAYSPDLRGALSMGDPNISGTTLVTMNALWNRYMGQRYFEHLGAQRVSIDSYTNALQKLESGQIKAAMVLEETVLRKNQIEGTKLEVVYPSDGAVVIPSPLMVINDQWSMNNNTSSAIAIAEWFLSEEGQNVIVNGWMHSVRRNFTRYPAGSRRTAQITANAFPIDWENINREEILNNFRRYVRQR